MELILSGLLNTVLARKNNSALNSLRSMYAHIGFVFMRVREDYSINLGICVHAWELAKSRKFA